jgi:hypothetical protein
MRYILIDHESGYVFGDTGELSGAFLAMTPAEAAQSLDNSLGEFGRVYSEHAPGERIIVGPGSALYHVYRAPPEMPPVDDGTNPRQIDLVDQLCVLVAKVLCRAQ